jgi:hypothetical protein
LHNPDLAKKSEDDFEWYIPEYLDDSPSPTDVSILKFGAQPNEFELAAYDGANTELTAPLDVPNAMVKGIWTGLCPCADIYQTFGIMEINILTSSEDGSFEGRGGNGLDIFTFKGDIKRVNEIDEVNFVTEQSRLHFGQKVSRIFKGSLDTTTGLIIGQWGNEDEPEIGTFQFRQAPAWSHQFRYSPEKFLENPARARWSFAGAAVRYQAQQQLCSWSYFKDRAAKRRRFLELLKARELGNFWSAEQSSSDEEMYALANTLAPADGRFYRAIFKTELRKLCVHP